MLVPPGFIFPFLDKREEKETLVRGNNWLSRANVK